MKPRIDKRGYKYWIIGKPDKDTTILLYERKKSLEFRTLKTQQDGRKTAQCNYILSFKNNHLNIYTINKEGKFRNLNQKTSGLVKLVNSAFHYQTQPRKWYYKKAKISSINKIIYKQTRKHEINLPRIPFDIPLNNALTLLLYPSLFRASFKNRSCKRQVIVNFNPTLYRAKTVKDLFIKAKIKDKELQKELLCSPKYFDPKFSYYYLLRRIISNQEIIQFLKRDVPKRSICVGKVKEFRTIRKNLKNLIGLKSLLMDEDIELYKVYVFENFRKKQYLGIPESLKTWKSVYKYMSDEKFQKKIHDRNFRTKFERMLEEVA